MLSCIVPKYISLAYAQGFDSFEDAACKYVLPKKSNNSPRKTYSIEAPLQKKLEYHILILTISVTNSNVDYNPKVQTKKWQHIHKIIQIENTTVCTTDNN